MISIRLSLSQRLLYNASPVHPRNLYRVLSLLPSVHLFISIYSFFAVIDRYSDRRRCFVVVIFERSAARRWSAAHSTPNNPKPQQIILEYVGNYLRRSLGLAGVKRIIWWRAELFDVNQDNSTGQIIPDHDVDKQPDARPSCTARLRLNGRNERKKIADMPVARFNRSKPAS